MTHAQEVTVDNFVRAETDRMFDLVVRDAGGVNVWGVNRTPTPLDHQPIIRQNRDTLYSFVLADVSLGAQITIPDTGERYASVMVINQDHYVPYILHDAGAHELDRDRIGTDFAMIGVRILVDPNDPSDIAQVNELQDAFGFSAGSTQDFTHPEYDAATFTTTREHLVALSLGLPDYRRAFGTADEVDPVRHLLASASAWGGFPETEAIYLNVDPRLPVGNYRLRVGEVPVDAFWSVTVYNAAGFMEPNPAGVVSVNSVTAVPDDDGTITVRFGEGDAPNTIPIHDGWNYMVRMYRPRAEALSRAWTFPSVD